LEPKSIKRVVVSRNRYFDSVFLMQVARRIAARPGMLDASALLATEANKKVLAELGYGNEGRDADFAAAGPNDLVIALEGEEAAVAVIAADPESWLRRDTAAQVSGPAWGPRSIREAVEARPDSSVAVISVPGEHAAREARAALEQGLNVFLFSSNVSVKDELSLKTVARDRGLMVMGPDCGTAYLRGAGIGFANAVRRGPIGIVASSGTGMQEFSSLVHRAGSGISHGIGTGSRDLSDEIGGISTLTALDALEADQETKVIVIISKPPGEVTAARLMERCARCAKPVVLCLLGAGVPPAPKGRVRAAAIIDDAVDFALEEVGFRGAATPRRAAEAPRELASAAVAAMRPEQRHVRGFFAGGSLCYQSQAIFRDSGLVVHSNSPIPGMRTLADPRASVESTFVDMGADIFVDGRPHPMIDATLRRKRLQDEGEDPEVALVLLDFILGEISSRDPVGDMLPAIRGAMEAAHRRGGRLCVVASVCGTDGDMQGLASQTRALAEAGVLVFPSNAEAAAFSREVALLLSGRNKEG
jgi:FdrA protein